MPFDRWRFAANPACPAAIGWPPPGPGRRLPDFSLRRHQEIRSEFLRHWKKRIGIIRVADADTVDEEKDEGGISRL